MKTFALTLTVLILSTTAMAQETPRAELFLGYSALVTQPQELINAEIDDVQVKLKRQRGFVNGWNGSIAVNANDWLGFVGDFSGHYGQIDNKGSATVGNTPYVNAIIGSEHQIHHMLAGPQFSIRGDSSRLFFRIMVGGVTSRTAFRNTELEIDERFNETGLAVSAGGGFDIKIKDRLLWRALQADYIMYRFREPKLIVDGEKLSSSYNRHNFRISTGLVIQ